MLGWTGLGGGGTGIALGGGAAFSATGGNQSPTPGDTGAGLEPGNGYAYHVFTSSGSLVVVGAGAVEMLVVAGGGGAGAGGGGGGAGGGGVRYIPTISLSAGTYPVTVGAAGAGAPKTGGPTQAWVKGAVGGDSTFTISGGTPVEGSGGGYGAGGGGVGGPPPYPVPNPDRIGGPGGSGGGSGYVQAEAYPYLTGGCQGNAGGADPRANPTTEGYDGGAFSPQPTHPSQGFGQGGGGAGEAAQLSPTSVGQQPGSWYMDGGDGKQYPQFTGTLMGVPGLEAAPGTAGQGIVANGWFAGGGGGANGPNNDNYGYGGQGGGGRGQNTSFDPNQMPAPNSGQPATQHGKEAIQYSGGGGGGAAGPPSDGGAWGGNGGSGIVVVRYAV